AFLHSGDRVRVLEKAARVLRTGGQLIFTDPMAADDAPQSGLAPILARLSLESMATPSFYRCALLRVGMEQVDFEDHTAQLTRHYRRVLEEMERREAELAGRASAGYRERMRIGLQHWIEGGEAGRLAWG